MTTIDAFVRDYRLSEDCARETLNLSYYASLSFRDAVWHGGQVHFFSRDFFSRGGDIGEPIQHPHIRMDKGNARSCAEALLDRLADLDAARQQGFEPLRQKIEQITSKVPMTYGGNPPGPLYWFDAAEAIGMGDGFELRPEKVYLAGNGPREAARMLGIPDAASRPWLDINELPGYFHHLKPWEAETCLCAIANLSRQGQLVL